MVEFILGISILIIVVALIYYICWAMRREKSKISFKESLDLTSLPVITFYNNGKKLNFLLDSGSTISHINKSIIKELDYTMKEGYYVDDIITAAGKPDKADVCSMNIQYNKQSYEEEFVLLDLEDTFKEIKDESGVQLHGILGNTFFTKYRYVLDFDSLAAYIK